MAVAAGAVPAGAAGDAVAAVAWVAAGDGATDGVGAAGAARLASAGYPEVKLLLAAAFFLATVTAVCAATDPVLRRLSDR